MSATTMLYRPIDLNILPERYQPRRISALTVVAVVAVAAVLGGLILAYGTFATARARTAYLQARLSRAEAALTQTQAERVQLEGQLEEVERQIEQVHAQIAHLQTELGTLDRQHPPRSAGIAAAVVALVPRVHIATVAQGGNLFTLTGKAGSQGLVLDYARALQASGQFANVRILSIVNTDPLGLAPEVEFSMAMEQ